MKTKQRIWVQCVGGVLLGAACLWLSLRNINLAQVINRLEEVSWPWVGAAAAGVTLVSLGKAVRWRWLYSEGAVPLSSMGHFGILQIAQMLNLLLPVRLGELARLGLMQQEGRPAGTTLGTVVVEKSLDLLAVAVLLFVSVPLAILPPWLQPKAGPSALITAVALLALLLGISATRERLLGLLAILPEPRNAAWRRWMRLGVRGLRAMLDGVAGLHGKRLVLVLALTTLVWLISVVVVQMVLMAFGIQGQWQVALVLMLALIFSNLVPTPPAMIGLVGAVTEGILVPFGVPAAQALALGTVLNAVLVGPPVVLGGWATGMRLLRVLATARGGQLRQALGLAPLESSKSG
jgi:uncharacterized protein (TIRG00374 family)